MMFSEIHKQIAESQRLYDSAIRSLTNSVTMSSVQKVLNERALLEQSLISSLSSSLNKISCLNNITSTVCNLSLANNSISSLFDSSHRIMSEMRSVMEQQYQWREIVKNFTMTNQLAELTLRRHTSEILSLSLASQSKIMELQSFRLGESILASESFQRSLFNGLERISKTYNSLFNAIGNHNAKIAGFSPVVTRHPPIDLFWESRVLEEITVPTDKRQLEPDLDIGVISEERSLEDLLMEIDPRLKDLLIGAHEALTSSNPDRSRHVATSLRELFNHVVQIIASDDDISQWTSKTEHFHQGRPTRRARLLYICRQIDFGELSDFVDADVSSALTLVNALHSGTHGIISYFSERQLRVLIDRMESLLLFLLRLNAENR